MKKPRLVLVGIALILPLALASLAGGQQKREASPFAPLRNKDVLLLIEKKVELDDVIGTIKSSWCNFDTFPPVLQDLRQRGVPAAVLQSMVEAPYGPPAESKTKGAGEQPIYHSAEQLKQLGFLSLTPLRRDEQGFSVDRGRSSILRH